MEMQGFIVKEISRKQDGYTISVFRPHDVNTFVIIKGHNLPPPIKQLIKVQGKQVKNDNYKQSTYQIYEWEELAPPNLEKIIEYLSSGVIKGLGPVMAKKIVAEFGKDTIQIMKNEINRLYKIPGVGEKLIEKIRNGFAKFGEGSKKKN
jgi:exodeoxyribonuclease V alpha subunit